jgi:hypothetical protein
MMNPDSRLNMPKLKQLFNKRRRNWRRLAQTQKEHAA